MAGCLRHDAAIFSRHFVSRRPARRTRRLPLATSSTCWLAIIVVCSKQSVRTGVSFCLHPNPHFAQLGWLGVCFVDKLGECCRCKARRDGGNFASPLGIVMLLVEVKSW